MKREWKPGDVAMVDGIVCMLLTSKVWKHYDPLAFPFDACDPDLEIRPVAVIDPEDREQVERLHGLVMSYGDVFSGPEVGDMEAALREFADPTPPKPPKPEEPTGLGAVVEDAEGVIWVRAGDDHDGSLDDNWRRASGDNIGWWGDYAHIKVVKVLSEGVTQ